MMLPSEVRNLIQEFVTPSRTVEVMKFVSANRDEYFKRHFYCGAGNYCGRTSYNDLTPWMKYIVITNLEHIFMNPQLNLGYNPRRYFRNSLAGEVFWIHT